MNKAHSFKTVLLSFSSFLLLTAITGCNSNEKNKNDIISTTDPLLTEKTTLTEEDAPKVLSAAMSSNLETYAVIASSSYFSPSPENVSVQQSKTPSAIARTVMELSKKHQGRTLNTSKVLLVSESGACTYGGTYNISYNSDSSSATYSHCNDTSGVYNGTMSINNLVWDGYDEAYSFSTNFTRTSSGGSTTMNGSFKMGKSFNDNDGSSKRKIADMNMSIAMTAGGAGYSFAVADYNLAYDDTTTPDTFSESGQYALKRTVNGITIEQMAFGINMNMTNRHTYNYPENGTITITGADNNSLTVVFDGDDSTTDDVTVTLNDTEIFAGTYEQFYAWVGTEE